MDPLGGGLQELCVSEAIIGTPTVKDENLSVVCYLSKNNFSLFDFH